MSSTRPSTTVAAEAEPPAAAGFDASALDHEALDQLARRLYDRISRRIKAELRLDRERVGAAADLQRR